MQKITEISYLLLGHLRNELNEDEQEQLKHWLNGKPENQQLFNEIMSEKSLSEELKKYTAIDTTRVEAKIKNQFPSLLADLQSGDISSITVPLLTADLQSAVSTHRIHFLKTAWFRYAAAILLLFGIGTYLYINKSKEKPSVTTINPVPQNDDVAPGGNKAVLTLADGTTITLDNAANGKIANERQATVIKTGEGKVEYKATGEKLNIVAYNTMATPRGGQYQLTLPDGSQVWLNAESSITYPTAFTGRERKVSITGEAYFEVAKDKTKPFIVAVSPARGREANGGVSPSGGGGREANGGVSPAGGREENGGVSPAGGGGREATGGGLEIEVLGTHFNVNSYSDEQSINTTLLEGSVRLSSLVSRLSKNDPSKKFSVLTLKPGQQGQLSDRGLSLAANPDVEQVMAWKNGTFYFQSQDIKTIMKQLARWYDLEVEYAGNPPSRTFSGEIERSLTLNQVLTVLTQTRIKYRIQGNKITILP